MLLVIRTSEEIAVQFNEEVAVSGAGAACSSQYVPFPVSVQKWVSLESLRKQLNEIYTLDDLSWLEEQLKLKGEFEKDEAKK
jgi:hypothetical protein